MLIIGTAGWAIPRAQADHFAPDGSALERYASRFGGVEINSSFHRPHRRSTWQRWAASVPAGFRFAAKIPKTISHERKLRDCAEPLAQFLDEAGGLGDKLSVLLLQLPPKLEFEPSVAEAFLTLLGRATYIRVVCEPRHPSWFGAEAEAMLKRFEIARVAADPAVVPAAAAPGGWQGLAYHRLHGSPTVYRSSYDDGRLAGISERLLSCPSPKESVWVVFDNTASGAAAGDALSLLNSIGE